MGKKIKEKPEEGGPKKLTASRTAGISSFSYSHHWEFLITCACVFGLFFEECKLLGLLAAGFSFAFFTGT